MKKWKVGELQALRAASRFLMGIGALAVIISGFILVLYSKLTPEGKISDVHLHDFRNGAIIIVVAVCVMVAGWNLGSFVTKLETQTGKSAKPFGWMP
jgi:hypothetical protein